MTARVFRQLYLEGNPVFVYHGIADDAEFSGPPRDKQYWLTRAQLREQLSQISQSGCETALLEDVWAGSGSRNEAKRKVVLTFDDGRESDYRVAFPLLTEARACGVFFVNTSCVGAEGFLNWEQIEEMQKCGMSFQSHGHDHVDLTRLKGASLERQLKTSKQHLEDHLGQRVDFLAAPYGLFDDRLIEAALEAGYRALCTTKCWPALPGARQLDRIVLFRHTTSRDFYRLLTRNALPYLGRFARKPLYLPRWLLLQLRPSSVGVRAMEER